MSKTCLKFKEYKCCEENMFRSQTVKCCEENMFKRQTVQMLGVKHVEKTNSTNVVCKTCLKDKQYKCCE